MRISKQEKKEISKRVCYNVKSIKKVATCKYSEWFKYYTTQEIRCIIRSHRLLASRHCGTVSHCREKVRSEDGNDVSQSSNPIGQYLVHNSTKMEPDLFCISCCANWIPLGVPTMVMIRSILPGFGSLMEISQDDWALSIGEEESNPWVELRSKVNILYLLKLASSWSKNGIGILGVWGGGGEVGEEREGERGRGREGEGGMSK